MHIFIKIVSFLIVIFALESYINTESISILRWFDMAGRYARKVESDLIMAGRYSILDAGRYGKAIVGYIGDPEWRAIVYPLGLPEDQNFPNPFNTAVYPNPFNDEGIGRKEGGVRTGRELTDRVGAPALMPVPAGKRILPLSKLVA